MPPNSKKKTADRYAPKQWGGNSFEDLTVPSGQTCLVRRPGVEGLVQAGVLKDIDSLSAIVDTEHVQRAKGTKPKSDADIKNLLNDEATLVNIIHTMDKIVTYVVVKPEVQMVPNDITSREDGVIYADMIDLEDKMFIMNFAVGGTRDLERFREEFDESVASLESGEDVEDKAE